MFILTYALKRVSKHETFSDAFIALYDRIMKEECLSLQLLETTIWIEEESRPLKPMFFHQAKTYAIKLGILEDCKINEFFRKKYELGENIILEDEDKISLTSTVEYKCPRCLSNKIKSIEFFDNLKECNNCGNQFLAESIE